MFWLWPLMTGGTAAAAPSNEGCARSRPTLNAHTHHRNALVSTSDQRPASLMRVVDGASRNAALRITTTLSRTWRDLSRVFGRLRDAIAYERLMHASFGWALSPMQRLMPSAAWPLAYANLNGFSAPTRGPGANVAANMFEIGLASWRGLSQPLPWQEPFLLAPRARKAFHKGMPTNDLATFAFAPMLGFAAGLQQMMPAMHFGLFG